MDSDMVIATLVDLENPDWIHLKPKHCLFRKPEAVVFLVFLNPESW